MKPRIYRIRTRVPANLSLAYRKVLTTQDFERIAMKHGYNLHSLLNLVYGNSKINSRTIDMISQVHDEAFKEVSNLLDVLNYERSANSLKLSESE